MALAGCSTLPKPQPLVGSAAQQGVSARITQYGIYTNTVPGETRYHPTMPGNRIHLSNGSAVFLKNTEHITGAIKTLFGFAFELSGLPPGKRAYLTYRISHPPIKMADGTFRTRLQFTDEPIANTNGIVRARVGYRFVRPSELQPGDWTMEVFLGGQPALKKTFHVTFPKDRCPEPSPASKAATP
jgi:hypothetical protein